MKLHTNNLFAHDLPESVIKRLTIQVKEAKGVNLGQGIPSFPTADHIRDAAKRALDERDIGVYPNFLGDIKLRLAIGEKLDREHGLALSAEREILVTVGAMEATATAILSLVNNRDRVGVITPDYCNHFPEIMLARGVIREIPLREREGWRIDTELLAKEAKRGLKLLILTNPNNPTGAVFRKEDIDEIVRLAQKYGYYVLSDETYHFLSYGAPAPSLLDWYDESDMLLTVRSFSKEYAMTGWRVGYIVAKPELTALFAKTHDALVGCVPKISQRAATAAITGSQRIVSTYVKTLTKRRDSLMEAFGELEDYMGIVVPQGAYYAFPRYTGKTSSIEMSRRLLTEVGLGVIPGSIFGSGGEYHIRLSFAVDDDVLKTGLSRLKTFFLGK